MACLYPQTILNPRWRKQLRTGVDNYVSDIDKVIQVPCGKCVNCLSKRAKDWRVRLMHEYIAYGGRCLFVTLTISPEYYEAALKNPAPYIRSFLEAYRYKTGHSCKHWFVTELGENTQRLHYHGLIFGNKLLYEDLHRLWKYGFSWIGYCNEGTIGYIVKYILKGQESMNFNYKPVVFPSPGLGKGYALSKYAKDFANSDPDGVHYVILNGYRYTLPRYYRQFVFEDSFLYDQKVKFASQKVSDLDLTYKGFTYPTAASYFEARNRDYVDSLKRKKSKPVVFPQAPVLPDNEKFDNLVNIYYDEFYTPESQDKETQKE